jgi:MYXO-CTERM domain-containing protein
MRHSSLLLSASACTAVALFSFAASAHIELLDPPPRYTLPANKSCPCGDGDSNRRCEVTAEESHDDNRSATVTTFEAGSTITVVAEEYIDHAGRMRVAFDSSGADLADFNDNILLDVPDPGNTDGKQWELEITLPTTPCENCTLQVIQAMHGDTENPVLDPAPLSTYYTCADIRIVPAGTLPSGNGAGGTANAAGGSANAAGGTANAAGGAAGSGSDAAAAGTGGSGGPVGAVDDDAADEEDSSCAFQPNSGSGSFAWALAALGLFAARQRRSRV